MQKSPEKQPAAASVVARKQTINTWKALSKLKSPSDQNYSVVAYFLVENPTDVAGMYLPLGNYPTREKALERAEFVIQTTGHRQVFAAKMGVWQELNGEFRPDRTLLVPGDAEAKLRQQHASEQEKDRLRREEQEDQEKELLAEKDLEARPAVHRALQAQLADGHP